MPNGPTHDLIGGGTGAIVAGWRATHAASPRPVLEAAAGAAGGAYSSRWPDAFDPSANGPHHRGPAHSVSVGALVASLPVGEWQSALRAKAVEYDALANAEADDWILQAWYRFLSWCCYALAGLLAGLQAGYVSHLIADATTPFSLPLVGLR